MKNRLTYIIIFFVALSSNSFSQSVSGEWYGVGNVGKDGNYSQYLSELKLKQNGSKVSGEYNYFFKSSYVPARVSGTYNSKTRVLQLDVFPLLNYKAANINGADCPMQGNFILKISKIETSLTGKFETTNKYKYTCPEIAIRFKKEVKAAAKKDVAIDKPALEITQKDSDTAALNNTPAAQLKPTLPLLVQEPLLPDPNEAITRELNKRSFDESRIIEVEADSLQLTLYDNGEVDGDTIALFLNRKLLVRNQRLSDKPLSLTIPIDTAIHEISMYAENLGAIPPNTALCVIMVGEKRYELMITSNFMKNGVIRFRKKTPAQIAAEREYYK